MLKLGWHSLGTAFDCTCGVRHELPIEACYVGEGAAAKLADFARQHGRGPALVVDDPRTRAAGGDALFGALGKAGIQFSEKTFEEDALEASQERADEVARAGQDAALYIGLGAGTLCDLAKRAGSDQDKPVLLFPTAASMNGYTSAIVALKLRGLKRTLPCQPALGVFADPEIVATAPQRMVAAGVADFLSKCSSAADWQAAHLLRGDYYCHRPREFNEGIQERLFASAKAIGRGETEAVGLVLEALLLSGFGMVLAGSSAPASGGEHLISHYLDMKHALYGTPNDLHGVQVGVATVYTLGLWGQILALDPDVLAPAVLVEAQPADSQIRDWIFEDWGSTVGPEVLAQWERKRLDPGALRAELERFKEILPQLRDALAEDLQPASVVAQCIADAGGPVRPEDMDASVDEYHNARQRARYLRDRFTVLDLAAELGAAP